MLHAREQNQQSEATHETKLSPNQAIQTPRKRGGKRPGAGREPNLANRLLKGCSPEAIREAVATLTDEELRLLDAVTKKLAAPTSNASPDPRIIK